MPVITAHLAFIFFDHELAIHSVGSHIYHEWFKNTIKRVIPNDFIFQDPLQFKWLKREEGKNIHSKLSNSRWNIFLITTVVPTILFPLYFFSQYRFWITVYEYQNIFLTILGTIFIATLFWFNVKNCLLIKKAIKWSETKHNIERDIVVIFDRKLSGENIYDLVNGGIPNHLAKIIFDSFPLLNENLNEYKVYGLSLVRDCRDEQRKSLVEYLKNDSENVKAVLENVDPAYLNEENIKNELLIAEKEEKN
jgi:hypothetical protein